MLDEPGRRLVDRTLRNGLLAESARPEAFFADGGDGEEAERGSLADIGDAQPFQFAGRSQVSNAVRP